MPSQHEAHQEAQRIRVEVLGSLKVCKVWFCIIEERLYSSEGQVCEALAGSHMCIAIPFRFWWHSPPIYVLITAQQLTTFMDHCTCTQLDANSSY